MKHIEPKKMLSNVGRAGAVMAAAVLSLGSTGADAAQGGAFIATAPSLDPSPITADAVDPIVVQRVEKVAPAPAPVQAPVVAQQQSSGGGGSCSLSDIKRMESGGDYRAQNPVSSASGAYQVIDGTWGGYGGYKRAGDAPADVQDKFAQSLYAKHGSQPWVVC
ncbi:MAG: transglycosylase family protein [bacterium]|nr:transglycosylase family protein [bacterium]